MSGRAPGRDGPGTTGRSPRPGGRIVSRASIRDDVDRELESHVRMRADELVAEGWAGDEAEAEARRLLGDSEEVARSCVEITRSHQRAVRRARVMDAMMQDLRYGVRTILRSPGFALVAIVTLALGIGANTAIFSVVDGVLLEALPYPDAEELVDVREARRQGGTMAVAWPNFVDWRDQGTVFDDLFAHGLASTTVLGGETPVTASVAVVTVDIWSALGVTPVLGRLTVESDHGVGAAPVVVVSEGFWRNELAGRPLEDLRLDLNGQRASVVGVVADGFDFPAGADIWSPTEPLEPSSSRTAHNWQVVGRLADDAGLARANEEIDALTRRIVQSEPDADPNFLAAGAVVRPLHEVVVGSARTPLLVLLGAAGLVLLIACTNLASTLLARGASRSRELAVRSSLGAGQRRLVRQLLTESVALAGAGAAAGVGVGWILLESLQKLGPDSVPRLQEVSIDGSVLLFAGGVSMLTVLLFGLLPALRLTRGRPVDDLRQGTRGNAAGRGFAWTLLVGTEVALALVLVVGSGLLVRSFRSVLSVDAGFDASDVVSTPVALSRLEYEDAADHAAFFTRAIEELTSDPSVSAAGVMSDIPLGRFFPTGRMELDGDLEKHAVAGYVVTSSRALEALDVPLLRGRLFDHRTDVADAPHVAIVSESFVREYWPNEDPIGRSVTGGGMDDFWQARPFAEVVGVVEDVRFEDLATEPRPTVYFPYTQRPFRIQFGATVVAEAASGNPRSIGPMLRETLQRLDPDIPVTLSTQREVIGASMASRQFTMMLLAGFSLLALTLAVVGVYGVVSYSVATRTREMGIRLALGADRGGVVQLVMKSAMGMVLTGLVVGAVVAYYAGRVIEGMLYEVAPGDPATIVGGTLVLGVAGLVASWIPAYLGTRVDPMITMRAE